MATFGSAIAGTANIADGAITPAKTSFRNWEFGQARYSEVHASGLTSSTKTNAVDTVLYYGAARGTSAGLFRDMVQTVGTWDCPANPGINPYAFSVRSDGNDASAFTLTINLEYALTVTVRHLFYKSSDAGILKILVDGVLKTTEDTYSAAPVANTQGTTTAVALAAGSHTITFYADGKNASSSNYKIYINDVLIDGVAAAV